MRGEFGFAVVGGAAGRVFAADKLDCPLDFEHQVGNGSVMVFHAGRAPIEIAANILRFFSRETCGGCLPCRVGVPEACRADGVRRRERLTAEQRESFDLLTECLETTARCGLGKTALRATKDLINLTLMPERSPLRSCENVNVYHCLDRRPTGRARRQHHHPGGRREVGISIPTLCHGVGAASAAPAACASSRSKASTSWPPPVTRRFSRGRSSIHGRRG